MKITPPKDKYIFIELTRDDMEKMNITYDNLDYSNPHTRKIIHHLLNDGPISDGGACIASLVALAMYWKKIFHKEGLKG